MDRPILFNGEMVRAILAGKKTQTRRAIKIKNFKTHVEDGVLRFEDEYGDYHDMANAAPWRVDDRLWVRETWNHWFYDDDMKEQRYWYKADYNDGDYPEGWVRADGGGSACPRDHWHPSIHMPKEAARIWLEVTGVRVERLQDISENDAKAEGLYFPCYDATTGIEHGDRTMLGIAWNTICGKGSWQANPWVWVIEFRRVG